MDEKATHESDQPAITAEQQAELMKVAMKRIEAELTATPPAYRQEYALCASTVLLAYLRGFGREVLVTHLRGLIDSLDEPEAIVLHLPEEISAEVRKAFEENNEPRIVIAAGRLPH